MNNSARTSQRGIRCGPGLGVVACVARSCPASGAGGWLTANDGDVDSGCWGILDVRIPRLIPARFKGPATGLETGPGSGTPYSTVTQQTTESGFPVYTRDARQPILASPLCGPLRSRTADECLIPQPMRESLSPPPHRFQSRWLAPPCRQTAPSFRFVSNAEARSGQFERRWSEWWSAR